MRMRVGEGGIEQVCGCRCTGVGSTGLGGCRVRYGLGVLVDIRSIVKIISHSS